MARIALSQAASGDISFVLEDRSGGDAELLANHIDKFLSAARKRPELAQVSTTFQPFVPQVYVDVDLERTLKQGVAVGDVYETIQTFMGGSFINYFNRFGREWQVYLQAEGDYRTNFGNLGEFYVRNVNNQMVPLSALTRIERRTGPEFTMRYNLYSCAQINAIPAIGYTPDQAMQALEAVFRETMPLEMGFDYLRNPAPFRSSARTSHNSKFRYPDRNRAGPSLGRANRLGRRQLLQRFERAQRRSPEAVRAVMALNRWNSTYGLRIFVQV